MAYTHMRQVEWKRMNWKMYYTDTLDAFSFDRNKKFSVSLFVCCVCSCCCRKLKIHHAHSTLPKTQEKKKCEKSIHIHMMKCYWCWTRITEVYIYVYFPPFPSMIQKTQWRRRSAIRTSSHPVQSIWARLLLCRFHQEKKNNNSGFYNMFIYWR